jgi:sugar phosphate isomerase/epimerase
MDTAIQRRKFLTRAIGLAAVSVQAGTAFAQDSHTQDSHTQESHTQDAHTKTKVTRASGVHVKLGLNAYSFNKPLTDGGITLAGVVDYCAQHGIDALDATGYYFPGYPKVPSDDYIFSLKRHAFVNGVILSGTGVRNDFTVANKTARAADVQMVKNWIEVAAKLGAPVIRVFTGRGVAEGQTFENTLEWMIPNFRECAEYGKRFGVIVGLQNHNDFLKTAAETIRVIDGVGSPWFGSILDIGSLRQGDPYAEIEKLMPYAVSWQLKEKVGRGSEEETTDLQKVKTIIDRGGYRGFLPVETLGAGDPAEKVAVFIEQARKVFAV